MGLRLKFVFKNTDGCCGCPAMSIFTVSSRLIDTSKVKIIQDDFSVDIAFKVSDIVYAPNITDANYTQTYFRRWRTGDATLIIDIAEGFVSHFGFMTWGNTVYPTEDITCYVLEGSSWKRLTNIKLDSRTQGCYTMMYTNVFDYPNCYYKSPSRTLAGIGIDKIPGIKKEMTQYSVDYKKDSVSTEGVQPSFPRPGLQMVSPVQLFNGITLENDRWGWNWNYTGDWLDITVLKKCNVWVYPASLNANYTATKVTVTPAKYTKLNFYEGVTKDYFATNNGWFKMIENLEPGTYRIENKTGTTNWTAGGMISEMYFEQAEETFSVVIGDKLDGGGGSSLSSKEYTLNSTCTMTAPDPDPLRKTFVGWEENGAIICTDKTISFKVTKDRTFYRVYKTRYYTLTVASEDETMGTVSGGGAVTYGTAAYFYATPNSGYEFVKWVDEEGNLQSSIQNASFNLTENKHIIAIFKRSIHTEIQEPDPEEGNITHTDIGSGKTEFTAIPAPIHDFVRWENENGEILSYDNPFIYQPAKSETVIPIFEKWPYISVYVSSPETYEAILTGSGYYQKGSKCTITAVSKDPNNYGFVRWEENNEEISRNWAYSFTVTGPRELFAVFGYITYQLTAIPDEPWGEVSGSGSYLYNQKVTVCATPKSGYVFYRWVDDDNLFVNIRSAEITATMDKSKTIKAVFVTASVSIKGRLNTDIFRNIFPPIIYDCEKIEERLDTELTSFNEIRQQNHGLSVYDFVYKDTDGRYKKALADGSIKSNVAGMVVSVASFDIFGIANTGVYDYETLPYKDSTILYLSDRAPGQLRHYLDIAATVYIPMAIYTDSKIILNIQQGVSGTRLYPYNEQSISSFDTYTQEELDEAVKAVVDNA